MIYHNRRMPMNSMSRRLSPRAWPGSMFHSCTDDPRKVERASKVMELLISRFASEDLFGSELMSTSPAPPPSPPSTASHCTPTELPCPDSWAANGVSLVFTGGGFEQQAGQDEETISGGAVQRNVMRDGLENYRGAAFLSDITAFQRRQNRRCLLSLQQQQPSQLAAHCRRLRLDLHLPMQREGQHQQQSKRHHSGGGPSRLPPVVLLHQRTPSGRFNSVKRRQLAAAGQANPLVHVLLGWRRRRSRRFRVRRNRQLRRWWPRVGLDGFCGGGFREAAAAQFLQPTVS
uniref:Uncharacterized protein n=1 Tax=Macrostomum lignano TaxID=282301 RepID=A0A1I8FB88_9PLAT